MRFGEFVVDSDTRQLQRAGVEVPLSPKAFQLLEILLEDKPRVIPKKELIERLWADTIVAEENLKTRIREIRAALSDDSRQWVRTARGLGYAFSGDADQDRPGRTHPPDQMYWLQYGEEGFAIAPGETYVGRDPRCGICIDDDSVSRKHARIIVSRSRVTLEDLGSKNGTKVGVASVSEVTEIFDGDRIRIGSVKLTFRSSGVDASTVTSPEE